MPAVLSPRQWGARVDYDTWDDPFTPDDGVALHHGGSGDYPAGRAPYNAANEIAQLQAWERYHIDVQGWRGLAYGWAVGQTGNIYRARGFNTYGAHTGDVDGDGIANNIEVVPILWIASGDRHTMSPAAQASIEYVRRSIILPKSPKATKLWGHRELKGTATACPGRAGMDYVNTHRIVEEDDMTPEERAALAYLVKALKSKRTDPPAWGARFWSRFQAIWGTPAGPDSPVTHLQLAFVWDNLDARVGAFLPIVAGDQRAECVRALKELLNLTYKAGLDTASAAYDAATIAAVKTHLGAYTGNTEGKAGRWVGGLQWARMHRDLAVAYGPAGGNGIDAAARAQLAAIHEATDTTG